MDMITRSNTNAKTNLQKSFRQPTKLKQQGKRSVHEKLPVTQFSPTKSAQSKALESNEESNTVVNFGSQFHKLETCTSLPSIIPSETQKSKQ